MWKKNKEKDNVNSFRTRGEEHDGFRLIGTDDGDRCFEDNMGNLSEMFYYAWDYSDGYAVVKKSVGGGYQFRDTDGNLSEEYVIASPYSCGYALVKKRLFDCFFQFRDTDGNLSEEYAIAWPYDKGLELAAVKKVNDGVRLRNTLGELSEKSFTTMQEAFDYATATITAGKDDIVFSSQLSIDENTDFYELSGKEILDHLDDIREYIEDKYETGIYNSTSEEEIAYIADRYESLAEYIKMKAYEEHERQELAKENKQALEQAKIDYLNRDLF